MLKLILASILLISTFCPAQKVEPSGKPEVPPAMAAALQDRGLRVLDKDGTPLVSVWPAKSVATSKKEVDGANYSALEISAFLGVVAFEQDGKDLRGQTIPKGTYTMRYALLPSDGNHMGVAPNRDFLLLLSLVSDTDPSATFNEKQLYRASGKVAGAGHPAVLSLVAAEGKSGSVSTSPEGYWILHFSVKTPDSELPIALIVKGVAQQ
jgi:hypothetical protein